MYAAPMLKGDEIYQLIPQRAPIVMVDKLYSADEQSAVTGLDIQEKNIFCKDGRLMEPGVIEHIAQSAAAMAGYPYYKNGEEPKLGYIGEIRKFKLFRLPECGETLETRIKVKGIAGDVTLITAESIADEGKVASCDMKIFLKKE